MDPRTDLDPARSARREAALATRASWKGTLKLAELLCPVALFPAASTADRIELHMINRATGHRLRRAYLDSETGEPVEREDQVKG